MQTSKDIIFINSHPIQYFAPMYKYLNEEGIRTKVWYCSDFSIRGVQDREFGVKVKWDIPLLEGYEYRFFRNYSPKKSELGSFWGLINLGILWNLFTAPRSVIVVHGWNYFTHFFVLLLGKLRGHTVCLRCEMPFSQELLKKGLKQRIKQAGLKYILFPRVDFFLYIGTQNRMFYESYGIAPGQLIFCPYSVDNRRFRNEFEKLKGDKTLIKSKIGVPADGKIILYSGKYVSKKRPLDVIEAFSRLSLPSTWLIMVGEGELRPEMERMIKENGLKNVVLTGFINQSAISEYYSISDVFVMSSEAGETWGLSVNEAMSFGLPVIVSDLTGCSSDLVQNGQNGYIFRTGDVNDLKDKLEQVLLNQRSFHREISRELIEKYSYQSVAANIQLAAV